MFNNDYTKLISSKVIRYNNYIETINSKKQQIILQQQNQIQQVFLVEMVQKQNLQKISDIEAAIKRIIQSWLQKLKKMNQMHLLQHLYAQISN